MKNETDTDAIFIGWDVGGWNCERNSRSKDALVILDSKLNIVGQPFRGNLRKVINQAGKSEELIGLVFDLCEAGSPPTNAAITLAIDTPLGFPSALVNLITGTGHSGHIGASESNPYLYRYTERFLFDYGLKPLSAIKDMIGSQATKGIHFLSKFALEMQSVGVWSDSKRLTVVEAYPSACSASDRIRLELVRYLANRDFLPDDFRVKDVLFEDQGRLFNELFKLVEKLQEAEAGPKVMEVETEKWIRPIGHPDIRDALVCALIAYVFVTDRNELAPPKDDVPPSEGWVWVPRDSLNFRRDRLVDQV